MTETSPGMLTLPAECDLPWARAFHEGILERAALDRDVEIDARAVERMTTPAVQVIVALSRALEAERRSLTVALPSAAFLSAFSDLGLADMAGTWSAT